jgi:uncharacterized protein YjiS (DUF1127 family)
MSLKTIACILWQWRDRRTVMRELQQCSDHQLADMGLSRSVIERRVSQRIVMPLSLAAVV